MSETHAVTLGDPVYVVWSTLCEQGFDAALRQAVSLAQNAVTTQIHADLCASAGHFEQAYLSASQSPGETLSGGRYARLALFADALGERGAAKRYSELAVGAQPVEASVKWIAWLIDHCRAHSAAVHMLHAYGRHAPQDARAPWWLAIALSSLPGSAASAERREALSRAYALDPAIHPALPLQLVLAYREIRDWDAIERVCREVLAKHPADTEMAWQLSHAQWQRNDAAGAEATMRAVDRAAPGNAAVVAAIGHYLAEQARYDESEATLHASLALDANAALPAVDLADLELRRGDWSIAWPRFEARLKRDDREANNIIIVMANLCARWRGEPLAGKTLVVHSEQGNGDDIQMVRFLPQVAARVRDEGGRLLLAVRRALVPLFERLHADCVSIEEGPLGKPDFGLPMMSMPLVLGLRPEQVRGAAYLRADPQRLTQWRERVKADDAHRVRLRVGLVWSGSPTHRRDAKRSIPLASLAPVLAVPDVVFYPLTPGLSADVAVMTAQGYRVRDLTGHYEAGFDDVAALVAALDAVVTVDSAPLHLGGSLGRPVLAMLDHVSHWCWGNAEQQSWYDSVQLYRQPEPGAWAPVVERVAARLQAMARDLASPRSSETVELIAALSKAGCETQIDELIAQLRARFAAHADADANSLERLAYALNGVHRFRDAVDVAIQGLAIDPLNASLHHNASYAFNMLGEFESMHLHTVEAAKLLPDSAHMQFNLATAQLRLGDFERGWKQYRWHEALPENHDLVRPGFPEWQGEPVAGCSFLLIGEQGLGDQLQFLRMADWLNRQGASVDVWVEAPLGELARSAAGVHAAWTTAPRGSYDYWCRMLRMPERMKLEPTMLPVAMPYLMPEPGKVRRWQNRLAEVGRADLRGTRRKRVGLVWAGNPDYALDRFRSIPLERFSAILGVSGVEWFSLQMGRRAQDEAAALPAQIGMHVLGPEINGFADTLAIINELDLVITVDTAVAHLAGAAGRPVWILLATFTDWRWMIGRSDSPWYPSARLFRQRELGNWEQVLDEVRTALQEYLQDT